METNDKKKTNDVPPIPKIGEGTDLSLSDALAEREYLLNHPKPQYGWMSSIELRIEQRVTALNGMIADIVAAERKTEKNGK